MIQRPRRERRVALICVALVPIVALTLLPTGDTGTERFLWRISTTPEHLREMGLNVALFIPFGAALAYAGLRGSAAIGLAALLSVTVELVQVYAIPGRYGEFQDIIANTLGGVVGWGVVQLLRPGAP